MKAAQKLFARKLFRLRVHESQGTAYQRLFEKVMAYRFSGFVPVKPYGRSGDGGNDGYIPSTGTYFQVHAPEDPTESRAVARAAKKVSGDFERLLRKWQEQTPVRVYRFVFNDQYSGCPKPVEDALAKIRRDHNLEAKAFLAKDLEDAALQLDEDQVFDVINTVLPELGVFPPVDFRVLDEVVRHVLSATWSRSSWRANSELLAKNSMTTSRWYLLTVGSYYGWPLSTGCGP